MQRNLRFRICCKRREAEAPPTSGQPTALSHRDIASVLGIGRARVFFHEKMALQKLRNAMIGAGIQTLDELALLSPSEFRRFLSSFPPDRSRLSDPFSPQHGWLGVHRIVSLNGGSEDANDVSRAFQYLKHDHERDVRPPVLVNNPNGLTNPYRIEAATVHEGVLRIRCWPNSNRLRRTVTGLVDHPCTAIVESIFDSDGEGEFDVPILVCAIIAARST